MKHLFRLAAALCLFGPAMAMADESTAPAPLRTIALPAPLDPPGLHVVVFLSARCPCSASHERELNAMTEEYRSRGVRFLGVHANADESEQEMRAHFAKAPLQFPWREDATGAWVKAFGAVKTPHAYLIDERGHVFYEGGVTGSHVASTATDRPLRDAIEAKLGGKPIERPRARTLGCAIARQRS